MPTSIADFASFIVDLGFENCLYFSFMAGIADDELRGSGAPSGLWPIADDSVLVVVGLGCWSLQELRPHFHFSDQLTCLRFHRELCLLGP